MRELRFAFHVSKCKIKMEKVEINKTIHLSEHITLGEVTRSRHAEVYNIPSHEAIENLKRVCEWLEELRRRYNERYVLRSVSPPEFFAEQSGKAERGGARGGLRSAEGRLLPEGRKNEGMSGASSDHPAHTGTPPNLGGEKRFFRPPRPYGHPS